MRVFHRLVLSIMVLAFSFAGNAQQLQESRAKDTTRIWDLLKYDAKSTINGVAHSFTRPLHWKKKDFTTLGAMVIGTLALSSIDDEFDTFIQRQEHDVPKVLRDFGWYAGSPQNYFMASAGIYGYGLFTKNEALRKTGVLILASSVTTGVLQTLGKNAIGRARPNSGRASGSFDPFSSESGFHAFPSGHTILGITLAHSIAKQFNNTWTKVGIYSVASIIPISRLLDGVHWLTDVTFSAALSIIVVDSMDKFLFNSGRYDYPEKEKPISWNLRFGGNTIGLVGTF